MEKLVLALIATACKLQHYFQAHTVQVLTNYPLRQVLLKPDTSGRLLKWSIELSQFDIDYRPKTAIKGQALTDFIAEFTSPNVEPTVEEKERTIDIDRSISTDHTSTWKLYADGSSNEHGSGVGIILISSNDNKFTLAVRFNFNASNNEAEYKALLSGLRLAVHLKVTSLKIFSHS